MYKPRENAGPSTNRLRLDVEQKLPTIYRIEQQLMEAKSRRGCTVELPWTTQKINQLFILSVRWEKGSDLPIWTLYEQNQMESKMLWSEQYPPGDLQIMFDVVAMSITGSDEVASIPESLRPKDTAQPMAAAAPAVPQMAPAPATAPPQPAYGAPGYPPPGMSQPGYPPMPGQPPYPVDPNMPPGYPYPYYGTPSGYPGAPPQGWPYPGAGQAPGQPPAMPNAPSVATAPPPPAPAPEVSPQVDYSLVSKRSKLQLGKLLVDSKLITQSTLDAALKIQELVEDGQVPPENAPNALNKWHTKGAAIHEFANLPELEADQPEDKKRARIDSIPEVSKLPISPPKSAAEARGAFDVLKKSGILTEEDIKAASEVRKKHGGDIIQILQSAGKLDKFTFEAAVTSLPLIELGLMKMEQIGIVMQYCSRMRVDFDSAIDELGWQNPRKVRKDLNL
jgi:hypothetical protein